MWQICSKSINVLNDNGSIGKNVERERKVYIKHCSRPNSQKVIAILVFKGEQVMSDDKSEWPLPHTFH